MGRWLPAIIIFGIAIIKIALIPFIDIVDADAFSRVEIAENWLSNPAWIKDSIWAPLHFYFIAIALKLTGSFYYGPILLHIFFSALGGLAVYKWIKNIGSQKMALFALLLFSFAPVLFRYSFQAMPSTPFLAFTAGGLWLLSSAQKTRNISLAFVSGLLITVACGLRYEAWLLAPLLCIPFLVKKQVWPLIAYLLAVSIFPITWMISCYLSTGDPLYGISGNSEWIGSNTNFSEQASIESKLKSWWFFPFSLLITVGPAIVIALFARIRQSTSKTSKFYLALSMMFLFIFICKSVQGELMHHHRFIGIIFLLVLPFISAKLGELKSLIKLALIGLTFVGGFIFNTEGNSPIPRLTAEERNHLASLELEISNDQNVLIDFIGWEETYGYAYRLKKNTDEIVVVSGSLLNEKDPKELIDKVKKGNLFYIFNPEKSSFSSTQLEAIRTKGKSIFEHENYTCIYIN